MNAGQWVIVGLWLASWGVYGLVRLRLSYWRWRLRRAESTIHTHNRKDNQ